MPKRQSRNPKRRIVQKNRISPETLEQYASQAHYIGSPHHKRHPADYDFDPPATNPRPDKSLCDGSRVIRLAEAQALFREGIKRGMVSVYPAGELPKYVWAVDSDGHVYEAKRDTNSNSPLYHGYELGENESEMKKLVLKEWGLR